MLQWIAIHLKSCFTKITVILGVTTVVFCFSVSILATPASAQSTNAGTAINESVNSAATEAGATVTDIRVIIARIIRVALGLLGIIAILVCLYGGYLWMTAGGNEEQIAAAKKVLQNGVIGLIIILSAYSIVLFVMRALGIGGAGSSELEGEVTIAEDQNFYGSGGLGGIIKDHYPGRGDKSIPRNVKIIVTFKKAINLASFVENTNLSKDSTGQDIYGDCVAGANGINWETGCDQLKKGSNLISVKKTATGEEIRGAAVLSVAENGKFYTIVLRPLDYLGSASEDVAYTVRLGNGIQLDDSVNGNPSIFASASVGRNFYEWGFTTNNSLDLKPPFVTSVFPENNATESKNSVFQIDFSEPIDPTGVQGVFRSTGDVNVVEGNVIYSKAENSLTPVGEFRLVNGYKTLEFTPTQACGTNACGGTIYCLPVCDKPDATCKSDLYRVLLKTAQVFATSSFEAIPFSGVMDLSGNAMDSNRNGKADKVPSTGALFPDQMKADNYYWGFTIENKVDRTAPYLRQVTPGPDIGGISADQELSLIFSKRMRVEPMYSIRIEEQPQGAEQICRTPRTTFFTDGTTKTELKHCPFNITSLHYYFPVVDSDVEDVKFNCFYPGKGPVSSDQASKNSDVCDDAHPENCCQVDKATGQVFCCNGLTTVDDTKSCIDALRNNSPLSP